MEKETESKIIRAAELEFMEKGYAGARTISIAEAAGVTHAMLHYYFRTKERLFERIIAEKIFKIKDMVLESMNTEEERLEEIVKNIIEKHLDFLSENPNLPRFLIGELYSGSERANILMQNIGKIAPGIINKFQNLIDRDVKCGKIKRVEAKGLLLDMLSLNVFSYLAAPLVNTLLGEDKVNSEAFIKQRKKENFETIMSKIKP